MKRWPLHKAYFWERAPFFRLLLPLAVGIIAYPYLHLSLSLSLLLPVACFVVFVISSLKQQTSQTAQLITFVSLQLSMLFIALLLCYSYDIRNDANWFGNKINTADFFEVRISEVPLAKEHSYKLRVSAINTSEPGKLSAAAGDGFVYVNKGAGPFPIQKDDTLLIPNKWARIKNPGNPFEFDYANFCAQNNIYYQAYIPLKDIVLYHKGTGRETGFTERCHDQCQKVLNTYIHDKQTLGILEAMLTGDNVNLDNDTRQAFAATGIVHIVAISGTHIGVLLLMVSWLLWWIRHKKYRWVKYLVALPLIWFYVLMAGAPPSALRAAVMFSILAVGLALQRSNSSLNTLFASAFILLCAQPGWLYAAGFQLSFVAVLSLILFYSSVYKWYAPTSRFSKLLWQTIAASIAAEILVAPLVIYYFHTFPVSFIVANVLAALFMALVLGAGIALVLLSFLPAIAQGLGIVCTGLVHVFNSIVHWLQQFNPASFYHLQLDVFELLILYLFITGMALFLLNKQKTGLFTGLAAACLLTALLCRDEYTALRQRKLIVYNTGKSVHAELIQGKRYTVLCTDTSARQQERINYITAATHTGYHAWRQLSTTRPTEIVQVGKNTVLLYKDSVMHTYTGIHADYLVLCRPVWPDVPLLYNSFSPKCIVLPQVNEAMAGRWKVACSKLPIRLHYLPEDGPLVLE